MNDSNYTTKINPGKLRVFAVNDGGTNIGQAEMVGNLPAAIRYVESKDEKLMACGQFITAYELSVGMESGITATSNPAHPVAATFYALPLGGNWEAVRISRADTDHLRNIDTDAPESEKIEALELLLDR